jgi:hypothetical protein
MTDISIMAPNGKEYLRITAKGEIVVLPDSTPTEAAKAFVEALGPLLKTHLNVDAIRAEPIDMLLFCPQCGEQHIDEAKGEWDGQPWMNPPHKSHLCESCGCIWRPSDHATNGVRTIATTGKADTWAHTGGLLAIRADEREKALALLREQHEAMAEIMMRRRSSASGEERGKVHQAIAVWRVVEAFLKTKGQGDAD